MTRAPVAIAAFIIVLLAGAAQAQTASELAGVWKRLPDSPEGEPRYFRLGASGDRLEGELLNPPQGVQLAVALQVLPGGQLQGSGTWDDGTSKVQATWELALRGPDAFEGRSEWLEWDYDGEISARGWDQYRFERLPRIGLVTTGPEGEEPFGDPIEDPRGLSGGWAGPGGAWSITVEDRTVRLTPVGDHHAGQRVNLQVERGALRGAVDPLGTAVELALSEGRLVGRGQWVCGVSELGDLAQRGWTAVELTRLQRIDGEGVTEAGELTPGDTSAALDGVWKRDDGLFLRLRPEGDGAVGVLSTRDGAPRCRVQLQAEDGRWVGAANWDGVETRWELVPQEGGGLAGRCEWVDVSDGHVASRGWGARTFKALRRVN